MRRSATGSRTSGPRRKPRAFLFSLIALGSTLASCEDPVVLGVRAHELRDLLRSGDRSLILAAPAKRLAELARLGPGALYYAARAAGLSGDPDRELALMELATKKEDGIFRRRAWELFPELLYGRRDWSGLLAFSDRQRRAGLDSYPSRRLRVQALSGLGRDKEAREELARLEADYPLHSAADSPLLAALRLSSSASPEERAERTRGLFVLPSPRPQDLTDALAAALEPGSRPLFTEDELALFRLRAEVARKDYGAAYRAIAENASERLSPQTPRPYLADAGKAYLYAQAYKEGIAFMTGLASAAAESSSAEAREALHLALFYRARMLRQTERYAEAAGGFARAYEAASTGGDRDAAAWYGAESLAVKDRTAAVAWLARTAPEWENPSAFADIVERLARESLLARDGAVLYTLRTEVAPFLTPLSGARLAYLAGRAAQRGIAPPPKGASDGPHPVGADRDEYVRLAFEETLARSPEPYYRCMAALRLGNPPALVPPSRPIEPLEKDAAPDILTLESFLNGFVDFGLAELAASEARALEGSPDAPGAEALRRLSLRLRDSGEYAQSMRVANRLFEDPGYETSREDWELLWPRPWLAEVEESASRSGMDPQTLYGLIRSESFFRPAVVSRAGAVGLAQLMPATAEEVARRIRLDSYDLTDPSDNIRLGSAHFAGLLRPLNGRVLPSVFAYNAGLSRVRGWERAARGFPDDLLLESLSIEETRQYGRNVLWASVVYGTLHYGVDPEKTLLKMLGE